MCYLKPFIPCSNLRQSNLAPVHTSLRTLSTPKPSNDGHVSNVFFPMFPILLHMFKYLLKRFLCSNLQGWQLAPLNGLRRVYNVITSDLSFAPLVTPLKLPSLDSPTLLNFYMLDFSELSPGDILYFFFTVKSFLRPYRLFCSFEDPGIWQQLKHFFLGSISFPWNPDSHKPWLSKHSH